MPDISTQQTEAAALIREQIEALENPAQTLPYWEVYRAISGEGGGGGGSTDVSSLAKETTLGAVNAKLPSLSSGKIPVEISTSSTTPDIRVISTPGSYVLNDYYSLYIVVLNGDNDSVILKKTGETSGTPLKTNRFVNLEPIAGKKHGSITLTIASGGSVEIIGES